jgi:hypothetical protein
MKKIVVCGCSFSSPVNGEYTGTHWAEILATKMNAELIVLARQGVSNNVIRLQIDEAVKHNPDWIFINATTPDRIELPVDKDLSKEYKSYVSFEDSAYNPATGLKNFNYPGHDNVMISETIFSIIDWPTHPYRDRPLSAEIKFAVKSYAACLYDLNWKTQCDNWIIASGLWDLHDRGIPFLYNPWVLNTNKLLHSLPTWFVEKYVLNQEFDFYKIMREYEPNVDPGYHTSAEGQIIIANNYFNRISG